MKLKFLSSDSAGLVIYGRRPFVKDWNRWVGISFSDLGGKPSVSFNTYDTNVPKKSMSTKEALDFIKKAIKNQSFYMLEGVNEKYDIVSDIADDITNKEKLFVNRYVKKDAYVIYDDDTDFDSILKIFDSGTKLTELKIQSEDIVYEARKTKAGIIILISGETETLVLDQNTFDNI